MANVEERFYSQLDVRVREWTQHWLAEGREQGIQQGRTEGLVQGRAECIVAQREGLRRQAALRFGASARLLDAPLEGVASAAKLAEIGVWLMVDTMEQFARQGRSRGRGRPHRLKPAAGHGRT